MMVAFAISKPKGLKKNNINVASAQALKAENTSGTNPLVYGNGERILLNISIKSTQIHMV